MEMTGSGESRRSLKAGPLFALCAGSAVILTGAVLIYAYVMAAVIARLGDPDQSLLFWYFPILVVGLGFAAGGLALVAAAVQRLRRLRREQE